MSIDFEPLGRKLHIVVDELGQEEREEAQRQLAENVEVTSGDLSGQGRIRGEVFRIEISGNHGRVDQNSSLSGLPCAKRGENLK